MSEMQGTSQGWREYHFQGKKWQETGRTASTESTDRELHES